jgi:hypothetical protein
MTQQFEKQFADELDIYSKTRELYSCIFYQEKLKHIHTNTWP